MRLTSAQKVRITRCRLELGGRGGAVVDAVGPEEVEIPDPSPALLVAIFVVVVVLPGLAEPMAVEGRADVDKVDIWVVHRGHHVGVGLIDLFDQVVDVLAQGHG
jgi:hypothetical protein